MNPHKLHNTKNENKQEKNMFLVQVYLMWVVYHQPVDVKAYLSEITCDKGCRKKTVQ